MQRPQIDFTSLRGKRFLITGGRGMLATSFTRKVGEHVPQAQVWAPTRSELDVCNLDQVRDATQFAPELIIHCAARVDADYCETNEVAAKSSILMGTANVIQLAAQSGAKLLYPQSFLIYDGVDDPITEATIPRPLSVYGKLKLEAENQVLSQLPGALVVRMGGFFGGEEADTNFVGKIVPHLAKQIAQGATSIEIGDRIWQPTFTDDLALNCLALLVAEKSGIYCMASHGSASFFELTEEIVKILGLTQKIGVKRIDASLLAAREKALRPLRAVIDNRRLRHEGLDLQRPWRAALAEYLDSPAFRGMF